MTESKTRRLKDLGLQLKYEAAAITDNNLPVKMRTCFELLARMLAIMPEAAAEHRLAGERTRKAKP